MGSVWLVDQAIILWVTLQLNGLTPYHSLCHLRHHQQPSLQEKHHHHYQHH